MVKCGVLAVKSTINGLVVAPGNISFYENGNIIEATLAESQAINKIKCRANSYVSFYQNGKIKNCILLEKNENRGYRF